MKSTIGLLRIMILLQLVIVMVVVFKLRSTRAIEKSVIATQVAAEHSERMTINFMARTVDRWDKLRTDNPEIKVPVITSPMPLPSPTPKE